MELPSIFFILTATFLVYAAMFTRPVVSSNFTELFQSYWAPDHITTDGDLANLTLDTISGCGFGSKKRYLFGKASAQLKLVTGDSAGTVTAFYMSSKEGLNHNELDFEFLGNVTGEPYLVLTNIYVNGSGNREQRHSLWFLVDEIPIRLFENKERKGVAYPKTQAMGIYGSLWNADYWATQGGRVKTNWSHSPFVSAFRSFEIDACELTDDVTAKCGKSGEFWWDKPAMNKLNRHQRQQLKWVRAKHLVYDYCEDIGRFSQLPGECGVY